MALGHRGILVLDILWIYHLNKDYFIFICRAISQAAGKHIGLGEEDENNSQYVSLLVDYIFTD